MQRTEIRRITPLDRTEFKRTGSSFKSGRPNVSGPVKARRPQSRAEKLTRSQLPERSGGTCEIQAPGWCWGLASVASHRKRRSQSGKAEKWCLTNLLHGCVGCERLLTAHGSNPAIRDLGWTVHPSDDPALIPVLLRGVSTWLYPDPDQAPKPVDPADQLRRIPDLSAPGGAA